MFFATTAPALSRRQLYSPAGRSLERFLDEAVVATRQKSAAIEQDETSFTLSFDVPGIAREQLSIGIEGSIVVLRKMMYSMDELEATEFLVDKLKATKNNAEFFDSMKKG